MIELSESFQKKFDNNECLIIEHCHHELTIKSRSKFQSEVVSKQTHRFKMNDQLNSTMMKHLDNHMDNSSTYKKFIFSKTTDC